MSSSASVPGLNTNVPSTTNGTTSSDSTEPLNAVNLPVTETPPPGSSGGSPYLPGRPGIPAWQLAAREKAQHAAKGEEEKEKESVQTA